jgi:hypothetical protein
MTDEAETTEKPARRRHCEHGNPLGACDVEECPDRALHRCLTTPCLVVGCENSRPAPLPPEEAFEMGLRQVRAEERASPNPADFPPEAVTVWEETQRLAARESSSSALPGALLNRNEEGNVEGRTEPWHHREPRVKPDLHHNVPIVFGTGDAKYVMWQQQTPIHAGGGFVLPTHRTRLKPMTERRAREMSERIEKAGVTDVTQEVLAFDAAGFTNAEIAARLKLTVDGVKSRLKKARARLKKAAG